MWLNPAVAQLLQVPDMGVDAVGRQLDSGCVFDRSGEDGAVTVDQRRLDSGSGVVGQEVARSARDFGHVLCCPQQPAQ